MKKGYINLPDTELCASIYEVTIEYANGDVLSETVTQYSYADVFDVIKENHEGGRDRKIKSIKVELKK